MLPDNWIDMELGELARIAPLETIDYPILSTKGISLCVKREDLLHPLLGGNKLYKLYGYLNDHRRQEQDRPIATFGGAYSNHILATAVAASLCGCKAIGIIRGERPANLSPTLEDAESFGMLLHFVSRSDYKNRDLAGYRLTLERRLGPCYWIPEGGAGPMGAGGVTELAKAIAETSSGKLDYLFHACGTGSSLAGLAAAFSNADSTARPMVCGVSVLKSYVAMEDQVAQQIEALYAENAHWRVFHNYHGGGYAKLSDELASFMQGFELRTNVPLDPVYTAKMMWAICDLAERDYFPAGSHVVAVHSGGLQGKRGFKLQVP